MLFVQNVKYFSVSKELVFLIMKKTLFGVCFQKEKVLVCLCALNVQTAMNLVSLSNSDMFQGYKVCSLLALVLSSFASFPPSCQVLHRSLRALHTLCLTCLNNIAVLL